MEKNKKQKFVSSENKKLFTETKEMFLKLIIHKFVIHQFSFKYLDGNPVFETETDQATEFRKALCTRKTVNALDRQFPHK